MENNLTVSLILTTYNCKNNLIRTLNSIDKQEYKNLEIIIKDGDSTDGTRDVIVSYAQKHANVKWLSSKDKGIYDALNQGIHLSTGDIIAICNDELIDRFAISKYVKAIEDSDIECVGAHSDLVYMNENKIIRYWKMGEGKINQGWMPGHPSLYLKREVYDKYGLYDISISSAADYEFMIRVFKHEENKLVYIPEVMISMYYGGTSTSSLYGYFRSFLQGHYALKKNGIKKAWLVDIKRVVRVFKQFIY